MKIRARALRLALIVEVSSLLVFVGEYSRTASDILFMWFAVLNMPTILLFRSHVWESVGRDTLFPGLGVQAFFQSLSLASASVLVAVVAAVAALLVGRIGFAAARWCIAVFLPLVLSYCIYWIPVWLGADASEYSAWALPGVGVPFLAGLVLSLLVTFIVTRHAKRHAS